MQLGTAHQKVCIQHPADFNLGDFDFIKDVVKDKPGEKPE
jgi:hypothetical protein